MIKVTFVDGNSKEFVPGLQVYDIIAKISSSLKKNAVVALVDGVARDLSYVVNKDINLEIITKDDKRSQSYLNHSCAHLLAQAIKRLYPGAKFWVGPVVSEGFYYDIDLGEETISEKDLTKIEKEMAKIVKENVLIERHEFTKEEALDKFKADEYKIDLINNFPENTTLSFYTQGEFTDLCRGPHVRSTASLKNFKLLKVAGAYWKGDKNNKMLTRIYGICFAKKEDLDKHLFMLEEAKKRDHRKLGKELKLFMMSEYGPGFPFFLPNGLIIRRELENYWYEEHEKENYKFITTPIMLDRTLWEKSGHWFNYRENMYTSTIDNREFAIKPMNCPGGMLVYANDIHSYKEFPLRIGELGLVHRHEASGALSGLFRVRNFTQDDAHIFITPEMISSEVKNILGLIDRMYATFGLSYTIELSTRPEEKYIGEIAVWDASEKALAEACKAAGKTFEINEGDGAFYGPKLDIHITDSLGREWQCGTIQLDMNLPERFDLTYIDKNGEKKRPVMMHRVIYGSVERFMGILIEHYAGAFPTWLAPEQVRIIPVNNEAHLAYAKEIEKVLKNLRVRCSLDDKDDKLGYKIRESQKMKVPYTLVIGDNEISDNSLTYRKFGIREQVTVSQAEFISMITQEIKERKNNLS